MATTPFLRNLDPLPDETGVALNKTVVINILDDGDGVNLSTVDAYIDGAIAYTGSSFIPPFSGPAPSNITIDGYDGYHFEITRATDFSNSTWIDVRVRATDYGSNISDETYYFCTLVAPISNINAVYFSDEYGIKKIEISDLVGESQSAVNIILSTTTIPSLPNNIVDSMHGEFIDGYFFLSFPIKNATLTDMGWGSSTWGTDDWDDIDVIYSYRGCYVVKNDIEPNQFSDGYQTFQPKMNNRGILYLINKTNNNIEVYYGANSRSGARLPDFIYSTTSTPALFPGTIVCLHIENNYSSEYSLGTRFYVGTTLGVTRIDACDVEGPTGYCAGLDNYGVATTYSISGGGATYEVIGGAIPDVTAVSSNEDKMVLLVATGDGISGGLSQISLATNRRSIYMTQASGYIPSNVIRDISGKEN